MSKRPELLIVNGDLAGRRYQVKPGGLRLGRSSSNDIHVPDEKLSRNHCLFETVDDGIRLTDLASANGTIVNGEMLGNDPVELHVGDEIEVGSTVVRVVGEGEPVAPAVSLSEVDLGFGAKGKAGEPAKPRRRSMVANALWGVAVLLLIAAACIVFLTGPAPERPEPVLAAE